MEMKEEKVDSADVKAVAVVPEKEVKKKQGIMQLTLKELETLDVQFSDILKVKDAAFNLSWVKIIRVANYNAQKQGSGKVLGWKHTLEEALEIINIFLL